LAAVADAAIVAYPTDACGDCAPGLRRIVSDYRPRN